MTGPGDLLRAMLGPTPVPSAGPPYTHVHRLPETDEEIAAAPYQQTFSVTRGRHYENEPLEAPAAFRRLLAEPLADDWNPGRYWPPTDGAGRECSPS